MDWQLLLSGSAMGSIITEGIRLYTDWRKKNKSPASSIVDLNDIYTKCMKPVLDGTPAERFLIVKIENGGGRITPGAQLFSSVIYEDYVKGRHSVMDKYQRLNTDKSTIELLIALCSQGSAKIKMSDLADDNRVKNFAAKDKITYSELYFLAQTDSKLFYCSIGTGLEFGKGVGDAAPFDEPTTRAEIELSVNNLRNIFAKYIKSMK